MNYAWLGKYDVKHSYSFYLLLFLRLRHTAFYCYLHNCFLSTFKTAHIAFVKASHQSSSTLYSFSFKSFTMNWCVWRSPPTITLPITLSITVHQLTMIDMNLQWPIWLPTPQWWCKYKKWWCHHFQSLMYVTKELLDGWKLWKWFRTAVSYCPECCRW